jgi:hypothetical protein
MRNPNALIINRFANFLPCGIKIATSFEENYNQLNTSGAAFS